MKRDNPLYAIVPGFVTDKASPNGKKYMGITDLLKAYGLFYRGIPYTVIDPDLSLTWMFVDPSDYILLAPRVSGDYYLPKTKEENPAQKGLEEMILNVKINGCYL